jgi:4-hydroxyphenylacetate 3-monooxygenase
MGFIKLLDHKELNEHLPGEQFIQSLDDGRKVWLDGGLVNDLPQHPAFGGTLKTISRLFNMLDEPSIRESIGFVPPGGKKYAHGSFLVPYSPMDLAKRRNSFDLWSRETHGMMSRLSDYGSVLRRSQR